jgi:hypothetical protein
MTIITGIYLQWASGDSTIFSTLLNACQEDPGILVRARGCCHPAADSLTTI